MDNHYREQGRPLRIAMFTEAYPPIISGVALATQTLVSGLRGLGHSIDVYAPRHPQQPAAEDGVTRLPSVATQMPGWIPLSLPITPLQLRTIVEREYDVVHTQHPFLLGKTARAVARRCNVPLVATIHTQYEQYVHYWTPWHGPGRCLVRRMVREYCSSCDGLITVAAGMASVLQSYGVTRPIEVIQNDLELSEFLNADGAGVREELHLSFDERLLLSVGRLAAEKNLLFLLDSLAPLLRADDTPARLIFVGDGPQRGELEQRAADLGIAHRVLFTGAVPHCETALYYAAADVFLMPSVTEVNPLVLGESMAAGTPVVAVKSFSACESIEPERTGLVVPHDAGAFRHAVEHLIKRPEICREMGRRARLQMQGRNHANAAQKTVQLYRVLQTEKARQSAGGFSSTRAGRVLRRLAPQMASTNDEM